MMLQAVPKLDCAVLTTEAEVQALAGEWRDLQVRASRSPFSDYDLFMIWWRIIGKTDGARSLHVVAGRLDGKLIAVLPLTVTRRHGLRIMQAAGYRAYNYCDMLALDVAQAIELWQAARHSPHYDFADIRDVYPESLCHEALGSFARRRDLSAAYSLRFEWPSGKDWLTSLSSHTRNNFKRYTRRLEEKGPVHFEIYREQVPPPAIIEDMVKQKVAWGIARKKHGLFEHPDVLSYFNRLIETTVPQGSLFINLLRCGDHVIAYNQGFIHKGVLHSIFCTYNPEWSYCSPGNVVLINSVLWAIEQGLHGMDFRQGENQFKRQHSNQKRYCAEFTFNGSARGWLIEKTYMLARKLMRMVKGNTDRAAIKED